MPQPDRIGAFDLETTGPDPESDRIVTAFIGVWDRATDAWVEAYYWILDPGVPISEGATAVHGYSDEDVQQVGQEAREGVFQIVQRLDIMQRNGLAIAGYNLRFDFTLLDREQARHYPGMRPLDPYRVLDGYVLWKSIEPYRKGKRRLIEAVASVGIPVAEDAHDAAADCLMAVRYASYVITHRQFLARTLDQIHEFQVKAAATQAKSLADYFRKQGNPAAETVRPEWPLVPRTENA